MHHPDIDDFVDALTRFVADELQRSPEAPDYNRDAIEIVDARNHLFRNVGHRPTDEAAGVYELSSLCRVDDETLRIIPDQGRIARIARNYFTL